MKRFFASTKARIVLAVTVGVATGIGFALPRIAYAAPTVEVNPSPTYTNRTANVTEGNSGTTPVTVEFRLSEPVNQSVSVTYATVAVTATSNVDYVHQSNTVTFAAFDTSEQVVFTINADTIDEADETFKVEITNVSGGGVTEIDNNGTGDGIVKIFDDDSPPTATVADNLTTDEGTTATKNLVFEVRLSSPAGQTLSYRVSTRDPVDRDLSPGNQAPLAATPGADYTALSNQLLQFNAGDQVKQVPVALVTDNNDEFDEHFELVLRTSDNVTELDWALGRIVDDDALARLDVSDPAPVPEGNSGSTNMTFTVTLTPASGKRVVVDFATQNLSATAGQDYTAQSGAGDPDDPSGPPPFGLAFAPGETSKTVTVPITGDTNPEPDERFALNLSNPENAQLGDSQAIGLIQNDEAGQLPTITIGDADAVAEGGGNASFTVTATRTGPTDTQNFTVTYRTVNGPESGSGAPATAGSDYTAAPQNASVTINYPLTTATITVPILQDSLDEPAEFFQVQLIDATNANIIDAVGQGQITDDDPTPTLSIADLPVAEGTNAQQPTTASLVVTLSAPSGQTVTVVCGPTEGSGTATSPDDYVDNSTILTFVPGDTSENCPVPVVADAIDEPNETVDVQLSTSSNAGITDGTATLTINDDDLAPSVSIGNASTTEGDSTNSSMPFLVSLSAPSGRQITVNVGTANGTAIAPGDYTAKTQTLTFVPGDTQETFAVTVIADTLDEANETFTAEITGPTNATLGSPNVGTGTIEDDDEAPRLAIDNVTVNEGNSGTTNATFTVSLVPGTAQQVTVNYTTADGSATQPSDYTLTSGTLTFAPGDTSKTITVPVKGDTAFEPDEGFVVNLSNAVNAEFNDATGNGTITNDDSLTPTTTTSTTTTTLPGTASPRITTGPGPGGGPHIKVFGANGSAPGVQFMDGSDSTGKRVARGDLDGDGFDEIITGSGANSAGVVSVYSPTGSLVASTFGYNNGNWFGGIFVAVADVDGDGKAEVITGVGPGGGPHVKIWKLVGNSLVEVSGFFAYTNAQAQPNWNGGVTVAGGDVNGDGKDDIITGPGAGGGPHVKAFNGANNTEMFGFYAYTNAQAQPNWNGGVNVAAGDVDNDGKAEIAVTPWSGGGAHLRLFNSNGSLRHPGIIAASNPAFNGGLTVAVGDLNGDGNAEIAVGSMTQLAAFRTYKPDLSEYGVNVNAYPDFGGGIWIAIGQA